MPAYPAHTVDDDLITDDRRGPTMAHARPEYRDGDLLVDMRTDRIGEYRGVVGYSDRVKRRVWLRPLGGGIEWDVPPTHVRRATDGEALSARNAAANAASRNRPRW